MGDDLTIPLYRSWWWRIFWALLALGSAAVAVIALVEEPASGVVLAVFVVALFASMFRAMTMGVRATPTELIVRREYRTYRFPWAEVEGFRTGEAVGERYVYALIAPGNVVRLPVPGFRAADRRELVAQLEAFRTSLRA